MSLFHVQEWYSNRVEEARFITNAQLIGNRDQILIGALNGDIVIVDPGKDVESRNEVSVLIEKRLPHPVLQILVGRFLATYDENLLAILHPKTLAFYRLNSADEELYTLERIFEHKLPHGPAYNMCLGEFSKQQFSQIYVQTLNCSLSIYEGENHLLDRQLFTAIHPGPIVYASISKCLYNGSGGFLACYPFHSFTSTATNQQKKLNYDWSINLGDTAVDIAEIDISPIQPSVIILCKRILFCVTQGGTPRFIIRLQAVATSLLVYKTTNDPIMQICIGTATRTLLFYRDSMMAWSAQLDVDVVPISMLLGSYGSSLVGMLSILSDDCKLVIGYLGTEPSLFRMPLTETRFIDFEQRRKEMEQFERIIQQNAIEGGASNLDSSKGLEISASTLMDVASMAYDTYDNVPSATITVKVASSSQRVDLVFHSEVFAHCQFFSLTPSNYSNVPITVFVSEKPARDARFRIAATTNAGESAVFDGHVPLRLLCQEAGSQRNAQIKLSIDSTGNPLSIADLYSDFEAENQISLGLQPFGSHSAVSVFSAGKNSRYRVQSDSSEFLYLVFDDLIRRLTKKQPDAQLNCPVPLHVFVTAIGEHVELEKRRAAELNELERISIQMRHVETVLLNKLKGEQDEAMTPINVLINYTYRELLTTMDRVKITEDQLERHKNETLKPILNLMQRIMELNKISVPFDGRILDGSEQTLSQRLAPLLGGSANIGGALSKDLEAAELTRLLVTFCEQGGRLGGITEEPDEEDIDANGSNEELKNPPGQELVNLETGALGVSSDLLELMDANRNNV